MMAMTKEIKMKIIKITVLMLLWSTIMIIKLMMEITLMIMDGMTLMITQGAMIMVTLVIILKKIKNRTPEITITLKSTGKMMDKTKKATTVKLTTRTGIINLMKTRVMITQVK